MRFKSFAVFSLLICPLVARAQQPLPLDDLRAAYAPYVNLSDPWDFPQKIMALRAGSYKYWRGSKDDFFNWTKKNCADWLADKSAYVVLHGDVHLGNLGSYVTDLHAGTLAFGLVDFDDTLKSPIQLEALESLITLRELAADKDISLTPAQLAAADKIFLDTYTAALASGKIASDFSSDPWVKDLFVESGKKKAYAKMLAKYVQNDYFIAYRSEKDNPTQLKEIFLHADQTDVPSREQAATALAEMVRTQPDMQKILQSKSAVDFLPFVKDIVRRIRFGSAGSQGQTKIFILLAASATTFDHDLIVYLKEEIPSAGERAGITPLDPRGPGRRLAEDALALTNPHPDGFGWCKIAAKDYWVSIHQPWSQDGDPDLVILPKDVPHAANILGNAAGASHAILANRAQLAALFTPEMAQRLSQRTDAYAARLNAQYRAFVADPRVADIANHARDAIDAYAKTVVPSVKPLTDQ